MSARSFRILRSINNFYLMDVTSRLLPKLDINNSVT
jgi:hypothetical protein